MPVTAREAVIAQGLLSFEDLVGLTDKDIKNVCTNAKKSGGTALKTLLANWVAGGNMPLMIANPGAPVGSIHK